MIDNNTCHSISAVAQIAMFTTYASDDRMLTAKKLLFKLIITFRVSRRRREVYCGHARLFVCVCMCVCVCQSVCLSVRGRMPTLLHGPGCKLGEW